MKKPVQISNCLSVAAVLGLLVACGTDQQATQTAEPVATAAKPMTMADIESRDWPASKSQILADRLGQKIELSGRFAGYSGSCQGEPPVSRSDWMLETSEGCVFVNGATPVGMSAESPPKQAQDILVIGVVREAESGVIYLQRIVAPSGSSGFSKPKPGAK